MRLIVDQLLAAGFIPITTWLQRASLPFKPAQGHRLQVKTALMFYGEMTKLFQLPPGLLLTKRRLEPVGAWLDSDPIAEKYHFGSL